MFGGQGNRLQGAVSFLSGLKSEPKASSSSFISSRMKVTFPRPRPSVNAAAPQAGMAASVKLGDEVKLKKKTRLPPPSCESLSSRCACELFGSVASGSELLGAAG